MMPFGGMMDDLDDMGRNRRRSSILFPFEPNSERGAFIQFMEESGANAALIKALKALYDHPEKPDTPRTWLAEYFRKISPKREEYIQESKETLRKELIDLESLILHMKDEEQEKMEKLKRLRDIQEDDVSAILPDRKEFEEDPQFRVDFRWHLAPDPFFKTTCSEEQLAILKKARGDLKSTDSVVEFQGEEDGFLNNFLPRLPADYLRGEDEIEEVGEAEEDEDAGWINAYNIYKKTSKLPEDEEETLDQGRSEMLGEDELEEEGDAEEETVEDVCAECIPKNFWMPGYTVDVERRKPDDLDSSDESQAENEDLAGTTNFPDPQNYYRPSKGPNKFVKRPERPDIIYEHLWQLWQTELPGRNDINYLDELNSRLSTIKSLNGEDGEEQPIMGTNPFLPANTSSLHAHACFSDRNVLNDFKA